MKFNDLVIEDIMKKFTEDIKNQGTKIGCAGLRVVTKSSVFAYFELAGVGTVSDHFIESVVDTIHAVDEFDTIIPDGYSFHAEISDTVIQETKIVALEACVFLLKFYDFFKIEEVPELDVFPGNEGHTVIALYIPGFDTIEIDTTDTGYHLYILQNPRETEWIVEENIVSRPKLFETLKQQLTFYFENLSIGK